MNPVDIIWLILGWMLLVVASALAVVIALAMLLGMWRGVRKWFPARKGSPQKLGQYMDEATVVAKELYKNEFVMTPDLVNAFKSGARWGWGFHRRK